MNSYISIFIAFVFIFLIYSCGGEDSSESGTHGRSLDYVTQVHFLNSDKDTISTIDAAIADTENERNLGLMDVYDLPPDAGMIFLFDDEQPRSFWMANTPLPLDIIYINSDREIVRIHQNTTPYSERQIPSDHPAQYVVEVNGSYTMNHGISEGMYIVF
ncbi:MAG: DUF192 domain-containing protein [Balneolales bacterium]